MIGPRAVPACSSALRLSTPADVWANDNLVQVLESFNPARGDEARDCPSVRTLELLGLALGRLGLPACAGSNVPWRPEFGSRLLTRAAMASPPGAL
jgi:hypothetical protein